MPSLAEILGFTGSIHVVDIGAAAFEDIPPYMPLLTGGLGRFTAVDGDDRQSARMRQMYGPATRVLPLVIGDGRDHTLHLCSPDTGMTSLLKPDPRQLAFFNGFTGYGTVGEKKTVPTVRLADVPELQAIDFLKMDVQGSELMILDNSGSALDQCVAIQTEASFIPLYEDQPTFSDIDQWMRRSGFLPHRFMYVKPWSIAPTIKNGDPADPFNQLLECDVVYIRGLVDLSDLTDEQLHKLALIAALSYGSPDLCIHAAGELEQRGQGGLVARVVDWYANAS